MKPVKQVFDYVKVGDLLTPTKEARDNQYGGFQAWKNRRRYNASGKEFPPSLVGDPPGDFSISYGNYLLVTKVVYKTLFPESYCEAWSFKHLQKVWFPIQPNEDTWLRKVASLSESAIVKP